jgi:hypothetical protein
MSCGRIGVLASCPLDALWEARASNPCAPLRPWRSDDAPWALNAPGPLAGDEAARLVAEARECGWSGCSTAWVTRCLAAPAGPEAAGAGSKERDGGVAAALLRAALAVAPSLQTLLLAEAPPATAATAAAGAAPAAAAAATRAAAALFAPAGPPPPPPGGARLRARGRRDLLPPLAVQRARVEDHDELAALLARSAARRPSLARLPAACAPGEPFALTRLVASQDSRNAALVARPRGGGPLVRARGGPGARYGSGPRPQRPAGAPRLARRGARAPERGDRVARHLQCALPPTARR